MSKAVERMNPENKKNTFWQMRMTGLWILLLASGICLNAASAGQAVTGKIVIDGVIYGDSNFAVIKGSGKPGYERRETRDFHSIRNNGGIDVHFKRKKHTSLEVFGDHNLISLIKTEVSNGVLIISLSQSYQTHLPLIVKLTAPSLKLFEMNGAGDTRLINLDENLFQLDLNGSGDIFLEGKVRQLLARLNGSSDINAKDLISDRAEIQILGSGDVDIHVQKYLKADIIGSGDIHYYGNPIKIEKSILGSGNVDPGD